jgi:hypothetical protein
MRGRDVRQGIRGQVRIAFVFLCTVVAAGCFAAISAVRMTSAPAPTAGAVRVPEHAIATPPPGQTWTLQHAAGPTAAPVTRPAPALRVATTKLPGSSIAAFEPSMTTDSKGVIYVTAPSSIGHSPTVSNSPLWKSTDGGASFQGPISTESAGQTASGIGGGDSDIVVDGQDNLYLTSLWLGNTSMSMSTDGGNTWVEAPVGHPSPVDDRPWFAYDPVNDALYMTWDGGDGIHVGKAALRTVASGTAAAPASTLVFAQDVVAVPEVGYTGTPAGSVARECVCPPGTMAVDSSGGVHVAFSSQNGVGIATSTDGGLTWNSTYVPGTATGKAPDLGNDFQWLRADGAGNLYIVWTQNVGGGQQVFMSWLQRGATDWQRPTRISTTKDGLFGTLAVVSPGAVDLAYYGTNDTGGDANSAASGTTWDVHLVQAQDLFTAPTFVDNVALSAVHTGSIDTNGLSGAADRSLGDFFSLIIDPHGMAGIVTATGNASSGTTLTYIRQTAPLTLQSAAPSPANSAGGPATTSGGSTSTSGGSITAAQPAQVPQHGGAAQATGVSSQTAVSLTATSAPVPIAVDPTASIPLGQQPSLPLWAPLLILIVAVGGAGLLLQRLSRR